jgi:hypothetical protein
VNAVIASKTVQHETFHVSAAAGVASVARRIISREASSAFRGAARRAFHAAAGA